QLLTFEFRIGLSLWYHGVPSFRLPAEVTYVSHSDPSSLVRRWTRRDVLQVGSLGAVGLSLPGLLAAEERRPGKQAATADSCILVFLNGGPSHLDMWDMKPEAPSEIRGEFKPIASSLSGVSVSEHLPRLALQMHRCSLIRSANHTVNNAHAAAVYTSLTGHDRGDATSLVAAGPNDYPAIGSVTALQRPPEQAIAPFVNLPFITKEGAGGPPQPGFFGGWLGRSHDPLSVTQDPNHPEFSIPELTLGKDVPPGRLSGRHELLSALDQLAGGANQGFATLDSYRERAFTLLASTASQRAFQLDQESSKVRESYGRNIYGQSVLLARRLIEAGTRVVTVSWAPDANATWDTHGGNFARLKSDLLPKLDAAVSSLLDDLSDRGMLERTLVVVMGEFGRSPKINANAGRDHWNFCYGLLLAGGGIRPGVVHGSSDRIGARPHDKPVGPADIVATVYRCLGISHTLELTDKLQRTFQLVPWGQPIEDILA
ncbi:MAG: DUF1501 domain-containing protein, partial [Planctomycetota bacterium]